VFHVNRCLSSRHSRELTMRTVRPPLVATDLDGTLLAGASVAVASAHPQLLAYVDSVVPDNDNDGVAQLIERLLASAAASPNATSEPTSQNWL
jgi:hypothetical protein